MQEQNCSTKHLLWRRVINRGMTFQQLLQIQGRVVWAHFTHPLVLFDPSFSHPHRVVANSFIPEHIIWICSSHFWKRNGHCKNCKICLCPPPPFKHRVRGGDKARITAETTPQILGWRPPTNVNLFGIFHISCSNLASNPIGDPHLLASPRKQHPILRCKCNKREPVQIGPRAPGDHPPPPMDSDPGPAGRSTRTPRISRSRATPLHKVADPHRKSLRQCELPGFAFPRDLLPPPPQVRAVIQATLHAGAASGVVMGVIEWQTDRQ